MTEEEKSPVDRLKWLPNRWLPTQTIGAGPFIGKPMNSVRYATILANRRGRS